MAAAPVVSVPDSVGAPALYKITSLEPLLFTAAAWTQEVQAVSVTAIPSVLIRDRSGALVARMEAPAVFVP